MWGEWKVDEEEITRRSKADIPGPLTFNKDFCSLDFIPRIVDNDNTLQAINSMLQDLGFLRTFCVNRLTMERFFDILKQTYRTNPYHDWGHAFSVGHFCYLMLKFTPVNRHLNELECYALLIACLCHDIDHPALTNSFQVASKSALSKIYGTECSVLEEHHFSQMLCILNVKNCNVFESLSEAEYTQILQFLHDIIVSTDIMHHLRIRPSIEKVIQQGIKSAADRTLLACLIITACDLSDQTRRWYYSKRIAINIYTEFFKQGDTEKKINKQPFLMMDRSRACLPKLQVDFLDKIGLPCFKLLAEFFPETQLVYARIYHSRKCWVSLHRLLDNMHNHHAECNLDVLRSLQVESNILRLVGPVDMIPDDTVPDEV